MAMGNLKLNGGLTAQYKGTDDFQRPVWKVVDGDLEFKMVCTNFDGSKLYTVSPSGEPCTPVLTQYQAFNLSDALEQFASDVYDLQITMTLGGDWEASHYPVDLTHLFNEYRNRETMSAMLTYQAGVIMAAWAEQE